MIDILTNKQCELLSLLSQNKEVMNSEQISDRVGISAKTIQRYIELINQYIEHYDCQIVSMRGYGYVFQGNEKVIEDILVQLSGDRYDRRIKDITLYMISKEYITIEEICDKIAYSASTLNKLIPEVKRYLDFYRLQLRSKPYYGVCVIGTEQNIRNLMIDCAFIKMQYGEMKCLLTNISETEFNQIKESIVVFLHHHAIMIADDDVTDLIMRTTIIVSRCKQNCLFDSLDYEFEENLVQTMLEYVAKQLGCALPASEISYLSMYFDLINSSAKEKQSVLQDEINDFVNTALEVMKQSYGELVIEQQIRESLILHLSLMFTRIHHHHVIKNPLLQDIKANYTLEMNYAIAFVKLLEAHFGVQVPEDELGYLALYFALSQKPDQKVKRVIILCNYGIVTSQLIKERIQENFPDLEVIGIYPFYYLEVVMNQDIDLIISTVVLDQTKVKKPYVVINQVLNEDSLQQIRQVLQEPNEQVIFDYLTPQAFFCLKAADRETALALMSEKMCSGGIFSQETIAGIYEREAISATDIGNLVAIPHTLIAPGQLSCIGIGILDKPVMWDKEKVQIIFMIGLNAADLKRNNVFKHLYRVVKDVSTVNRMIESRDFETCLKLF